MRLNSGILRSDDEDKKDQHSSVKLHMLQEEMNDKSASGQ